LIVANKSADKGSDTYKQLLALGDKPSKPIVKEIVDTMIENGMFTFDLERLLIDSIEFRLAEITNAFALAKVGVAQFN
jgi:hypothetical protein